MGPPGSGKGTQANLVAEKYNLYHLDTGRFVEQLVHDPQLQNDPEVVKERKNFDEGILLSPLFFLKWVKEKVKDLHRGGVGIVFSGSPRTELEAFGDKENGGLVRTLEELYGKDDISVFLLEVPDEISVARNSARTLCSVCGSPIMGVIRGDLKQCPFCGGSLRTRVLDTPDIIKVRLEEYRSRTMPVVAGLEERGFVVYRIDGTPLPFSVFEQIKELLDDSFKK